MNLRHSWIIALKDIKVFIRKRTVLYILVILPLMLSVLFPLIIGYAKGGGITGPYLLTLLHSFEWFFVIIPAIIPAPIAYFCLVGENLEKSL